MAKIRGNKYISVEERKALDDISEQRNSRVSLGTKLYDLTNQLASEIEGEPISESFPKSVHDLEDHEGLPGVPAAEEFTEEVHALTDHTGITGCGGEGAETFTKEVHDLEDHSTLPGIPSITGLLDETAHDALDHAGLTGIPSVTGLLDETAHDALDHTGLTGCGGLDETAHDLLDHTGLTGIPAAEAFTKDVHDLEDHGSLPGIPSVTGLLDETAHDALDHAGLTGIPSVTGLLDETAHDALDHTGLTGCGGLDETAHDLLDHTGLTGVPAAEAFTESAHALVDHSSQLGVPSTAGLLDETAHDALDHAGLTGVPSVAGLLDESAHDALDHTGLTGVPAAEAFTKDVHDLEDHGSLPGIPSITGLLDETAHDALDHTGLTGVPSVAGLLDETAHDALDHTGITGIILEIAETHEDLPADGFYWYRGYGTHDGAKACNTSYDFADFFVGKGEHNYLFKLKHSNITNNTCTVEIHADNAGVPAAAVLHTLSHVINSPAVEVETEFDFGLLNLTDTVTYWLTISYNADSGILLASSEGTSKEKFGEGSWEDYRGALAFVLIISTTIENSKVYLCQEENVIYGVDDTNTKVKKLTIPVIEIPKDTMYHMLDSQVLSAYLPADNSSGDMVALISMSDENFFFGIYANPIYIYMWRSNWAVPGWQLINPVLPTQFWRYGTEISYTNYSAPKGTMWLKEAEDGTFSLMYQGVFGQGTIGGVSDADVEGASGYNVWYDSLVDLQAYASDYGYGAVHFVWEEKCLYYYDDTDPENPVWVKLAPLQAANQAASTATTIEGLVTDFNALLTKLKNAGMMAADA